MSPVGPIELSIKEITNSISKLLSELNRSRKALWSGAMVPFYYRSMLPRRQAGAAFIRAMATDVYRGNTTEGFTDVKTAIGLLNNRLNPVALPGGSLSNRWLNAYANELNQRRHDQLIKKRNEHAAIVSAAIDEKAAVDQDFKLLCDRVFTKTKIRIDTTQAWGAKVGDLLKALVNEVQNIDKADWRGFRKETLAIYDRYFAIETRNTISEEARKAYEQGAQEPRFKQQLQEADVKGLDNKIPSLLIAGVGFSTGITAAIAQIIQVISSATASSFLPTATVLTSPLLLPFVAGAGLIVAIVGIRNCVIAFTYGAFGRFIKVGSTKVSANASDDQKADGDKSQKPAEQEPDPQSLRGWIGNCLALAVLGAGFGLIFLGPVGCGIVAAASFGGGLISGVGVANIARAIRAMVVGLIDGVTAGVICGITQKAENRQSNTNRILQKSRVGYVPAILTFIAVATPAAILTSIVYSLAYFVGGVVNAAVMAFKPSEKYLQSRHTNSENWLEVLKTLWAEKNLRSFCASAAYVVATIPGVILGAISRVVRDLFFGIGTGLYTGMTSGFDFNTADVRNSGNQHRNDHNFVALPFHYLFAAMGLFIGGFAKNFVNFTSGLGMGLSAGLEGGFHYSLERIKDKFKADERVRAHLTDDVVDSAETKPDDTNPVGAEAKKPVKRSYVFLVTSLVTAVVVSPLGAVVRSLFNLISGTFEGIFYGAQAGLLLSFKDYGDRLKNLVKEKSFFALPTFVPASIPLVITAGILRLAAEFIFGVMQGVVDGFVAGTRASVPLPLTGEDIVITQRIGHGIAKWVFAFFGLIVRGLFDLTLGVVTGAVAGAKWGWGFDYKNYGVTKAKHITQNSSRHLAVATHVIVGHFVMTFARVARRILDSVLGAGLGFYDGMIAGLKYDWKLLQEVEKKVKEKPFHEWKLGVFWLTSLPTMLIGGVIRSLRDVVYGFLEGIHSGLKGVYTVSRKSAAEMHSGTQASDAKDKTSAPELEGKSPVSASYKKHRGAGNYAAAYFSMWPGVLLGGLVGGVSRFVVEFVRNIGSLIDGIPYGFYYGAKAALTGEWTEARKGFSTSGHGLAGYLFAIPISIISLISTFGLERSKQDFTTTMTKSAYFLGAPMALVGAIVGGVSRVLIESVLEIGPAMIHGYRSAFPFKSADSTNNEPIAQSEDARRTAAAVAMRPSLKAAVGTFEWYEVHKYLFTGVFFSIGKVLGYGTRVVMTISDSIRQFIIGSAIGLYRGAIAGADYAPSQMTQYRTEAAPKSTFWLGGYWLFGGLTFFVTAVLRTVRDALVGLVRGIGLGLKNGALNRFAAYRKEDELIKHVKFHAARIGFIPYYVFTLVGGAMRSVADVVAGVLLWGVYSADAGFSLNTAGLFELASNIKKYRSYASYIVSPIVIPGLIAGCVLRQVANVIRGLFEGLYYGAKMGFNLSKDEIKKHIKESWTAENATSLLLFPFTAFVGGCAGLVARGVAELAKVQWGEVFTTFFGGLFGGLGYVIGYLFNKGVLDVFRSLKNIFQPFADLPQGRVFDWRSFIPSVLKVIATAAAAVLTVMSAGSLAPFVWPGLVVLNSAISAAWERSVDPMLIAESVMEPMTKFANNGQGRSKFLVALTRHHEELKGVYKEVTKGVTEVNEKGYTEKQTSVNYRFYRDMLMTSSAENGLTHMLECLRDGRIQYDKDEQVDSSAATFNTILTDGKKLGKSKFGFFNSGSDFTLKGGDTQRKYDYTYNAKEDRLHIKALGVGATSEKYDDVDLRKSGLAPTAAAQAAQAPVQAVF